MTDIVFVAPDENLLHIAEHAAETLGMTNVKFLVGALNHGVRVLEESNLHKSKLVISRGWTASLIKDVFPQTIVIDIRTHPFDFIRAFCNSGSVEGPIAITGFHNTELFTSEVIELLSEILNVKISIITFCALNVDLGQKLEEAKKCGIKTIAGGKEVLKEAEKQGLKRILLGAEVQAVIDSFNEAERILQSARSNTARINQLNTIINSIAEGIMAIDKQGRITILNRVAERILGIKNDECIGKNLNSIWPNHEITESIQEGVALWGCLQKYKEINLAVHLLPLLIDQEVVGGVITFQEVEELHAIESHIRKNLATRGYKAKYSFDKIVYRSEEMGRIISKAKRIALSESTVLICGETGSGKEVFAQSVHNYSSRKNGPFVAINCAGLPASLLASELFGYVDGAFTGARRGGKAGVFEQADRGTIFLDEISEMPIELQSHLLRVTQEKQIMRIGDNKIISVDVRIIAATNQNLEDKVGKQKFREDLYYRLNVLRLNVPPLRERLEDIEPLLCHFLFKLTCIDWVVSNEATCLLKQFSWKGNVRQLENFSERLSFLCTNPYVEVGDIIAANEEGNNNLNENNTGVVSHLEAVEITEIRKALKEVKGNKKEAARILGISYSTLRRKLNKILNPD